ncbi:hypothetical protein WJX79_002418 [Trebouxia sp. C0005]
MECHHKHLLRGLSLWPTRTQQSLGRQAANLLLCVSLARLKHPFIFCSAFGVDWLDAWRFSNAQEALNTSEYDNSN